ncbi:MAG TPA: YARHG domain-containing protein [Methyloceanibacter sp.]|nr:YARHG domain-containing protein [Methyloceanibacter sp.]
MRSRNILMLIGFVGAAAAMGLAAPAYAGVCSDLWVQRNAIYKANGYCFKTRKAINYFGNAGCLYDNAATMPMSGADKSRVLAVKTREKQLGCL